MNNQYFTPDIEDIRVGYECESFWNQDHLPTNEWFPIIVGETGTEDIDWRYRINNKTIRVPYLTKEQIEAEGWDLLEKDVKKEKRLVYFGVR